MPGDDALVETYEAPRRRFVVAGCGELSGAAEVQILSLWTPPGEPPQIREMRAWERVDGKVTRCKRIRFPDGGGVSCQPRIRADRARALWADSIPWIGFYGDRPVLNAVPGDPLTRRLGELLTAIAARPPGEARALLAEAIGRAHAHVAHVSAIDDADGAQPPAQEPAPTHLPPAATRAIADLAEAANALGAAWVRGQSRPCSTLEEEMLELDRAVERLRDLAEESPSQSEAQSSSVQAAQLSQDAACEEELVERAIRAFTRGGSMPQPCKARSHVAANGEVVLENSRGELARYRHTNGRLRRIDAEVRP